MADERTFEMALRTGDWAPMVMLPFHKPVTITLAPEDAPGVVLRLRPGLTAVPAELTAADLQRVTVSEPGGRPLLVLDRRTGAVAQSSADPAATARNWSLLLEGPSGLLSFYSRGDTLPSAGLLHELAERLPAIAKVD